MSLIRMRWRRRPSHRDVDQLLADARTRWAQASTRDDQVDTIDELLEGWYGAWPPTAVTSPHYPIAEELVRLMVAAQRSHGAALAAGLRARADQVAAEWGADSLFSAGMPNVANALHAAALGLPVGEPTPRACEICGDPTDTPPECALCAINDDTKQRRRADR